ncbi:UBP1-associated protein 2B-like [Senna tora]|uniref:UBP1-associated protein 2B-like n=1 Tax=Senna tora TaxID=362788 RepID=A0A834WDS0_9FABA|nr:UBP1-associated protein 2B-like [Senna tora]
MPKKRKLPPSSEPQSTTAVAEPQPPEQQIHSETEAALNEQQHQEPQTMAVDGDGDGGNTLEQQEEVQDGENPEEQEGGEQLETAEAANDEALTESAQAEEGTENEDEEGEDLVEETVDKLLEPFTKDQLYSLVKQAVEKHPGFMENIRQLADVDPAHRKIFVHGLGWDATAEILTSVFGKYGEIEDCKAVTDKLSGKSKGYAFILFKHRTGARKALKQPQKKIGNRITSCQLASAGPVQAPPPTAAAVSVYTPKKIFVSNVGPDIDPQKLLEFFKQFGEIEEGPLGLDKQTGKPKGFAFFVYKSAESAKKALDEPHKNFEGHTLYCQKAVDGPKGNKGYHQQQHQHHSHHHHQPHHHTRKEKNKYPSRSSGPGPGHLMAPSAPGPAVGFNPGVPPVQGLNPALGQALTALLTTQGGGLGLGNLLGGIGGAPVNQAGPPAGYGNQAPVSYGNQPGMQPGYQNPQMGQSGGVRPHPGAGPSYMGIEILNAVGIKLVEIGTGDVNALDSLCPHRCINHLVLDSGDSSEVPGTIQMHLFIKPYYIFLKVKCKNLFIASVICFLMEFETSIHIQGKVVKMLHSGGHNGISWLKEGGLWLMRLLPCKNGHICIFTFNLQEGILALSCL